MSCLKCWKKQMKDATLHTVLKAYWKIYWNRNIESFRRDEQQFFLKKIIQKRLPKRILPAKVWFFGVTQDKIRFNPWAYEESKRLFEQLMIWKKKKT